jgi:hypothetical protein
VRTFRINTYNQNGHIGNFVIDYISGYLIRDIILKLILIR